MKLAIFGSGRGSNFQAILNHIQSNKLHADVSVVIVNNENAPMKQIAENNGIPVISVSSQLFPKREDHEKQILEQLENYEFDLIILAGYMRLLSHSFIERYTNRILNIHPSLLPSFPGLHAHKQALEYGVKVSGVTVHLVDQSLDGGRILAQRCVPVNNDDTEESLSDRILAEEHEIYAETIQKIVTGEINLGGN